MKKLILPLLFICAAQFAVAQSQLQAAIRLVDTQQKPMVGEEIKLVETTTGETVSKNTDTNGVVIFNLTSGKTWDIHFKGVKYKTPIQMPEAGGRARSKRMITYNPKKYAPKKVYDRSKIQFTVIDQRRKHFTRPKQGQAVMNVKLVTQKGVPVSGNHEITLIQYDRKEKYLGRTGSYGKASFLVPIGLEYAVDVGKAKDYSTFEVPAKEGMIVVQRLVYVPTKIKELSKNDTIIQNLKPSIQNGTSERVFVKIQIKNKKEGEPVYLNEVKGQKIYKTTTNKLGIARFLLPKDMKYMVHFQFQRDVDVVDLVNMWGIGSVELRLTYRPDPRLEHPEKFIPTPEELLVNEFNNFVTKQFPEPQQGRKLDFDFWWGNRVNKNSQEALLNIGFRAIDQSKIKLPQSPVNVSFVIDKSGSMAGYDRIESLQRSLIHFVDKLRPQDIVSLITFDTETKVLIPAGEKGNGQMMKEKISKVIAGGGTIIFDGMVRGYEEVLKNFEPKGTNRLVLLTDGYGTVPIDSVVNKSKAYNARGVELSAIGVGQSYNQALLRLLATEGGGLLHYTGEAEGIDDIFARELESVLRPIAKNATFEIEYNKKIVFQQLYGFPITANQAGKASLKLNNVYSGLNRLAMVKFDLNKPKASIVKAPVILRLKYLDLETDKEVVVQKKAFLKWSKSKRNLHLVKEEEEKKLYAIAHMNQTLKVMAEANAKEDYAKAQAALKHTAREIKKLFPNAADNDVKNLMAEIDRYVKAFDLIARNKK